MKKSILLLALPSLAFLAGCGNKQPTKSYNIKFVDWNGEILQQSVVEEGTIPVFEGEQPHRDAPINHEYIYVGWDKKIVKATEDATYKASYDYVFNFGDYPQTLVTDLELINELDNITSTNAYGYKEASNGKEYFQYSSEQSYSADDGTWVNKQDEQYKYYEVQPIQWTVLIDDSKDKGFYTTYKLLVQQIYNELTPESENDTYDNSYDTSHLNAWLNGAIAPSDPTEIGDFYWRAFRNGETMDDVSVDNSLKTTCDETNPYASDIPTSAKVFALSRLNLHGKGDGDYPTEEYDFGKTDSIDTKREARTTDFARATGASYDKNKNGMYWTRSPANSDWTFGDDDYAYIVMTDGYIVQHEVDEAKQGYCARPAIRLTF
ncbi:MAG: hypothetical protein KBS35_01000 [Mycoplasma sp.]|nr:hypothetical protein [Candidatus Hennigella equi]